MKDLNTRDYDVSEIDEDPRMANARNEAVFVQIFFTIMQFGVIAVCFIMGNQDPRNMTYFFGWPTWYIWGVLTNMSALAVGIIWVTKKYKMDTLGAFMDDKEAAK